MFAQPSVAPRPRHLHAAGPRQGSSATRDAAVAPELLGGPGWFDSSWELRAGLEVREGMPDDVRLDEWVDAFCAAGRRPEPVAAAA
jgi:hypothetical protein